MCDRVIIINKGKIVADDLVENMKSEMSANHRITKVSFRDDIDKEKLESKKDIISLKELGPGTYELVTDESVDLAQILFDFAIQSNTIILEQREIEKSLESVFQHLTKNV
jgi:ABC-2 type transport system ATP-binding protein